MSLASGIRIVLALRSRGHDVIAFDPSRGPDRLRGRAATRDERSRHRAAIAGFARRGQPAAHFCTGSKQLPEISQADVVFLALHGGMGEDGTIQALLDMAHVKYTGTGHLSSALAMDKELSKKLFRAAGVQTADWLMAPASVEEVEKALGFPVVVKPSKQGSTVGTQCSETDRSSSRPRLPRHGAMMTR